ncbi:Transposase, IS4 [Rhizobium freirei PRF 81]|uniref:Transposase, IS4 n=2 Tax=Rhizobium freirei TaxID=1353277 RepID=N6UB89_9HYPH|nr:Transposase, IS4 [Rhizobium freirei PRF 81]
MSLLEPLPLSRLCAADTAYDSNALRLFLIRRGIRPVIPNNPTRKRIQAFDPSASLPQDARTTSGLPDMTRIEQDLF